MRWMNQDKLPGSVSQKHTVRVYDANILPGAKKGLIKK
jgi:hypothetical protein